MTQAVIRPTQPQSIGEVLDTSFQLYRASLGQIWPLCLLMGLATMLAQVYLLVKGVPTPDATDPMAALRIFQDSTFWMIYLLGIVLGWWLMGASYLKVNAIGNGQEMSLAQSLQLSLGRLVTLVAAGLVMMIAIVVGLVLFIIPGFILMGSLVLCWNIALVEDKGPLNSVIESHRLVWGHWWRTSAILAVAFIILIVLYVAVGFVVGVVTAMTPGAMPASAMGSLNTVIAGVGVSAVVTPFFVSLLFAVYWDLKLRKHGGDLAARVGALSPK